MKALSHQRPYKRAVPSDTHDPFDRYADGAIQMLSAVEGRLGSKQALTNRLVRPIFLIGTLSPHILCRYKLDPWHPQESETAVQT